MSEIKKKTYIDSLKGVAIILVVMKHSGGGDLPLFMGTIGDYGHMGVQMFLLISAYLSFRSLEKFFLSREYNIYNIIKWQINKILILIPLYYLSLIICIIMGGFPYWLGNEEKVTIQNIIFHLLFAHGLVPHYADSIIGVEWYIGVLVIFYFIAPVLFKYIKSTLGAVLIYISSLVFEEVWRHAICLFPDVDGYIYTAYVNSFCICSRFSTLALGIVLFFIIDRSLLLDKIMDSKIISYIMLGLALVILLLPIKQIDILDYIPVSIIFTVGFAILFFSQEIYQSVVVDNFIFNSIGKYSYPIYLFHFPILNFIIHGRVNFGDDNTNLLMEFIITIFVSFIISILLDKYINRPIRRVINGMNKKG